MSTAKTICILFVCSLAAPFAGAQSDFRVIVTFKKPPIYLPRTTFWKYALPPIAEAAAGDDELSVAYRTYLMHDRLSGRAYLNPVLQKGAKDAGPLQDLRPLSLECLLEMPDSPDHFLVSTTRDDGSNGQGAPAAGGGARNPAPLDERLLSARVKKTGRDIYSSILPWIALFDGYQRYADGRREEASAEWKRLASSGAGGGLLTGLAWLGVAQIAGEGVTKDGQSAESQAAAHEGFVALTAAEEAFSEVQNGRGAAQAHMMSGQMEYLIGNADTAVQELKAAGELFQKAKDLDGWTDLNVIWGLGLKRAGKTDEAENGILAAEEGLGKLRVELENIKQLAEWTRRMPSLVGKADPRPIEPRLADAREFHRWASRADPMIELIALQSLAAVLREGGYLGDADFYEAMRGELEERYHALVPLSVRIGRAAMADYDLLSQTHELEQLEPANLRNYNQITEAFISAQEVLREQWAGTIPELNTASVKESFHAASEALRKIAAQADNAGASFAVLMKSGDRKAAGDALAKRFRAMEVFVNFLNAANTTTHMPSGTETVKQELLSEGKLYGIEGDISYEYRFEAPSETKLELLHEEKYLDMIRDIVAAVALHDEAFLRRGVRNMVSFYDQYRTQIPPPDLLDLPFTFEGGWDDPPALPSETEARKSLTDKALTEMREREREKAIAEAVSAYPDVAAALAQKREQFAKTGSIGKEEAGLRFFERNWAETGPAAVTKHEVSRTEQAGKVVIQIHLASSATFKLKEDGEYSVPPPPAAGIDLEARARSVVASRDGLHLPLDRGRFDRILEILAMASIRDQLMQNYLGTTPGQLAQQGALFSNVVAAGQIALSARKSGDFIPLDGGHPFQYWRGLLTSDQETHAFASMFAQISPDDASASDDSADKVASTTRNLMAAFSKAEKVEDDSSARKDQNPARSLLNFVALAQTLRYKPFLLLLLGDEPGAQRLVDSVQAARKSSTAPLKPGDVDGNVGLALYSIATGAYDRAIESLKAVPAAVRRTNPEQAFQIEYLLAMCYRRAGDAASQIASLSAAANDLDKLRTSLRTHNQALAVQALRQMIYEEYLGSLYSQKNYTQMSDAIRRYKRSSQLPISALRDGADHSELDLLVGETVTIYDLLSRDDVWKAMDPAALAALQEILNNESTDAGDSRQATLVNLNHVADVLVDEMQPAIAGGGSMPALAAPAKDEMDLFYFVGRQGLFRVVVGGATPASARFLPVTEKEISDLCGRYRSAIEERRNADETSNRLYDILLGDLTGFESAQRLNLSPDGALNFIPFQALKSRAGGRYLIEDHVFSYLSEMPSPAAVPENLAANTVLAIGNPDGTLPAAEREASDISHLAGMAPSNPLLHGGATIDNLRANLPKAGFVHFATHSTANPAAPNFGYLQLAGGERLYSLNLGGLSFSGKHIFLSACETRMGQNIPGEGVYGVADSFLAGGAASVVSTLWRIESDSSALFARRYYELLMQTHNAASALAMTEREFIQGKWYAEKGGTPVTFEAPLYWAGYNHLGSDVAAR